MLGRSTISKLCSFSNLSVTSPMSQLILQPFRQFTYVTAHSPTLPSLYLYHSSFSNPSGTLPMHSSFSNPSVASPTLQFILQPFFRFSYVTGFPPTSPGEPPMQCEIFILVYVCIFKVLGCVNDHRCGASGNMSACHAAGPGSIPGRDRFPGWGFFRGFSSPVRQMSGNF